MKTALFLLPHVLLYVLLDGTQDDSEEVGYRVSLDVRNVLMVVIKKLLESFRLKTKATTRTTLYT